jgi:hypothetical protein
VEVLMLTVFASGALVVAAIVFFAWNVNQGSHEHADRLSLMPLDDDVDDERPN